MNQINSVFFSFLRLSLFPTGDSFPKELDSKYLDGILKMADEQTVSGLIINSILRNGVQIERKQLLKIYGKLEKIKAVNQRMNSEILTFAQIMDANRINYTIFKGQTIASLYPDPLLRMPGDIDFFVSSYTDTQFLLFREWNIKLPDTVIDKEVSFKHGQVLYELHTKILVFQNSDHQRYWEQMIEQSQQSHVMINGKKIKTFEPNIYAVYVFVHLFFHFIREGIGLRQMCDWAIILEKYKAEIDELRLNNDLEALGIKTAYTVFGEILTKYLGLKYFPIVRTKKCHISSEKILQDILHYGNFGKPSRVNKKNGWKFKMETMSRTFRNCWNYWQLAPTEILLMIPKLIMLNIRLLIYNFNHDIS